VERPGNEPVRLADRSEWVQGATMDEALISSAADVALIDDLKPLREQLVDDPSGSPAG
jgi:hypothetical protein